MPTQPPGGALVELVIVIFSAVADNVFRGPHDTALEPFNLLFGSGSGPLSDHGGGVDLSVDAFSLGPRLLQTQRKNDLGNLATHFSGGAFADSPGTAHNGGEIERLFHNMYTPLQ